MGGPRQQDSGRSWSGQLGADLASHMFLVPAGIALVAGLGLVAAGAGSSIPGLVAYTFSAFVLASIVYEFVRGTRARRALSS